MFLLAIAGHLGELNYNITCREAFLGGGIFNRDGDSWKAHRALAKPFFSKERIKDFEDFEQYTSQTLDIIENMSSNGKAFDAQDLFARLTLDASATFVSL